MKTVEIKVFTFDELSDKAKEKAHENYLTDSFEWAWNGELVDTLKAFASVFPVKIHNYQFDSDYANVNWDFEIDEIEITDLSGIRLLKYLYNNYGNQLFTPKYIGAMKTNEKVNHKRIKSSEPYENGNRSNFYYSAIQQTNSCVLTGVCFDEDILQPIYDFMKNPTDATSFDTLLADCIQAWENCAKAECASQLTMEYFKDICESNEYGFLENGNRYNLGYTDLF